MNLKNKIDTPVYIKVYIYNPKNYKNIIATEIIFNKTILNNTKNIDKVIGKEVCKMIKILDDNVSDN